MSDKFEILSRSQCNEWENFRFYAHGLIHRLGWNGQRLARCKDLNRLHVVAPQTLVDIVEWLEAGQP